jgi:hypothetical protein
MRDNIGQKCPNIDQVTDVVAQAAGLGWAQYTSQGRWSAQTVFATLSKVK